MVTVSADPASIPGPKPLTRAAVALVEFHAQRLDITEVLTALEVSILLVPVPDGAHLLVGQDRGLTWVPAFTAEQQLRRYADLRGEAARRWQYRRFPGARLLGPVLDAIASPCGLAIDIAGRYPLLLPRRSGPVGRARGLREVR